MSKNINDLAAEWEEFAAEAEAGRGDRDTAWQVFRSYNDLYDVDELNGSLGQEIRNHIFYHFGKVAFDDHWYFGDVGADYVRSQPSAEIEDGVYAVIDFSDDGALTAHVAAAVRERLSNGYYDCDDDCDGGCDHAELRRHAERVSEY